MINIIYHRDFLKSAKNLQENQQRKLAQLIHVIQDDPFDSLLHTKRLSGELTGFLSFRITRDWRCIFQFLNANTIFLLRVKHRKDIYRE